MNAIALGPRGWGWGAFNGSYIRVAGGGPAGGDSRGELLEGGWAPRFCFALCLFGDTFLVGCSMYVLVGGYRWTNTGMRENQNDIVKRLSGALGEHSDASLVKLLNSELLAVPATGDWRRCHRLRIGWIEAIQARFNDKRTDATIVAYSPWLSSRGMRRLHAQWERCGDALKSLERCLPSPSSSF